MNILGSGSSHMQGSMRMRAPAASAAAANARCQKCQQQGHWTYECNQDYLYKSRPTRTQQLLDPKYRPKFMDAREVLPEDQPAQAEPAKAPRKRRRHQSDSSSSDSDSSSSSDSGSSSSSDSDSSSSSDGSTSSARSLAGSTSSSGSDSSSSSGSSSSDASSSESSSDSEEDKPPCQTRKRLPEYPVKEPRQNGMQDSDRQHYARHERGSDRRMPSASRRATEHYNDEAAYRGDSRRADYERHRQSERRSVDRHVRPDLKRQDTRRRIASKISVPDTYTAARQEPHSHATDISREQPFGDRWNGRYEPINGSHAHHEERAHQGRSRQQNRAASGSSDYTGSSGDTGSSASSGRS